MKELSGVEKLELAEATIEALGFDLSEMTVAEAFEIFHAIKGAVSDTLAEQMEARVALAKVCECCHGKGILS